MPTDSGKARVEMFELASMVGVMAAAVGTGFLLLAVIFAGIDRLDPRRLPA